MGFGGHRGQAGRGAPSSWLSSFDCRDVYLEVHGTYSKCPYNPQKPLNCPHMVISAVIGIVISG